ncbi:MAG: outer membrane protein multidrug efflux system [Acidobacteriota bacterium]|jgi:multidrug efflux system outer membrane protein|nr:outer membrane protein multidrug efflux system [Acidobacteriota bacterium]
MNKKHFVSVPVSSWIDVLNPRGEEFREITRKRTNSEGSTRPRVGNGIKNKKLITTTLVLSLLSGTAIGQKKYERPPVKTPAEFRGAEPISQADANSIGDLKWFEVFQDEALQKLVRTAMAQNYDLRLAVARINAARANVGLARSNQFPQFDVGVDLTTTRTSVNSGASATGQGGRTRSIGSVLLGLLTFEIDLWGRRRQQTKAARAQLVSTEEDRKVVATVVVSDLAAGYFNLLELDAELDIAKRTLNARQESLRIITARQQGGLASMLEVRQAEQLVYEASQTIPDTERMIEQTENQISLLVGNNPGPIPRGTALSQQKELPGVPVGLPSSLLERRPDIRSAEQLLISEYALVAAAKAAYFPTISLTGAFGFQSNSLANLFSGPSRAWSFIPQLTQPIFTAGRLESNVNFEKAQREYALAQYQQTIQTAFSDVSNALVQYRRVREIRTQQELLVSSLQDASRLAHLRYEGGVDTLLNALVADTSLFNAELSLAQTKRNEQLSLIQLYKALGGGWQ